MPKEPPGVQAWRKYADEHRLEDARMLCSYRYLVGGFLRVTKMAVREEHDGQQVVVQRLWVQSTLLQ